ncbi:MAG: rhomboid family intramembrane serine protease [Bacteroidales bacterium]|nr:rhomboid family intramembrane serine protease [Bacteroidales bacterium]
MAGTNTRSPWVEAILTDRVWQLMAINLAVFVALHVAAWLGVSQNDIAAAVVLPAAPRYALTHLWTAAIYMFAQWDIFHLIFNMLWLWTFGLIMVRMGVRGKTIVTAYIVGGLAAAAVWLTMGAAGIAHGGLVGSSAAILSVIAAGGVILGRQRIQMMLLGTMQVRWLALGVIVLCVLTDATVQTPATVAAHAAGVIAGVVTAILSVRSSRRSRRSHKPHVNRYNGSAGYSRVRRPATRGLDATEQAMLDSLLLKIKNGGYGALTPAEKQLLFSLSTKINDQQK